MVSTGDLSLDKVLTGLQLGDNVVWQIDSMHDYRDLTAPFVRNSLKEKRRVVYIRFANHKPLFEKSQVSVFYEVNASLGFESFSTTLNGIIRREGKGVFYVFDCLSDLLSVWSNDLMIGNFFKITCPFLFELDTIAYFSIFRYSHSFKTIARIRDTTQLLIDVYRYQGHHYVHPLKVWNRYTPAMFLPHVKKKGCFVPIASSVDTARLFSNVFKQGTKSTKRKLDSWDRIFMKAEDLAGQKGISRKEKARVIDQLSKLIISRDEKILKLARENLTIEDFLTIKSRMIGTGFIGGKSVGMLIARNILAREKSLQVEKFFEPHDSFYIGSDVFYTYIVENGWWNERMEQKTQEGYFTVARTLREKLLRGFFPEELKEQFQHLIDYFGQSPIIVRSSSLLEDGYGNAFAGKYESIFLVNQGTPEERYEKFVRAILQVYASTLNEDALAYRLQRGLDKLDEQMALLVQRVSGIFHGKYFFPDVAGVGISYNAFVWKKDLDPKAGMLRLVLGLGTRAVNRVEGDYPRIVALDDPLLKVHGDIEEAQRFSQHDVDVLNVRENTLQTVFLGHLLDEGLDLDLDLIATRGPGIEGEADSLEQDKRGWIITFDQLFSKTRFGETMRKLLRVLQETYQYPVDIEFTVNFKRNGGFQLNLLQCRPMQTKGLGNKVDIPETIDREKILFQSHGNFIGGNVSLNLHRIIYVDPKAYCALKSQSSRYDIARAIGELNKQIRHTEEKVTMLLGPGRWGTSTPSLGVPVSFSEINNVSVLGEIAFSEGNVMPELSYGTHFFQDLVEAGIFYLALFPGKPGVCVRSDIFNTYFDGLGRYLPSYKKYDKVIKVYDASEKELKIMADVITQKVLCFSSDSSLLAKRKK